MGILQPLKILCNKKYSCAICEKCQEIGTGCKMNFTKRKECIILRGELINPQSREQICDCISFIGRKKVILIGIIELTSKNIKLNSVINKLNHGVNIAQDLIKQCNQHIKNYKFYLVVLAKNWKRLDYEMIKDEYLNIKGKRNPIILNKCGVTFSQIIKNKLK